MSKRKKIRSILTAIAATVCSTIMLVFPDIGSSAMIYILCFSLLYSAVKKLLYYFTMARNMIGGNMILGKGFIELDLAWFAFSLHNMPKFYATLYIIVGLLLSAVLDILMSLESKRLKSPSWKYKFMQGILSIVLSILCLLYIHSIQVTIFVFCLSLVQTAIIGIMKAFRKQEIVYIQ